MGLRTIPLSAVALIVAATSACSSGSTGGGGGGSEACAFVAVWHGTKYTDVLFRYQKHHLTSGDIRRPEHPGRYLGRAQVPSCPDGNAPGEPVRVYAVPGVAPAVAVMTTDRQIGVAEGRAVPDELIRRT